MRIISQVGKTPTVLTDFSQPFNTGPLIDQNGNYVREIGEGLKLVWGNRTLWGLAWLAGTWQFLHHMQVAVLILFATRDLGLSAGAIGICYVFGGAGCVLPSRRWRSPRSRDPRPSCS